MGQGEFDPGEDISICKVVVDLKLKSGSITGKTFYCQVWTMSGTSLDVLQGESDGVTGDDAWDNELVDFEFSSSVDLSNGTEYCIVVTMKEYDGSNYAEVICTSEKTGFDGAAGSWYVSKTRQYWYSADFKCNIYTD